MASDAEQLPVPEDDGACDHLPGTALPDIELTTTDADQVNFSSLSGLVVIFIYPRTGQPEVALPEGWAQIPGAMGCTPQACGFRDHHAELKALGAQIYGLSVQDGEYQQEAATRLELPYPLVSDEHFKLVDALKLPTFQAAGMKLTKRAALVVRDGIIEKVFYPVFPPGENAEQVIDYLS